MLNNVWAGYNTSLFAYGQSGSGKSWSIFGYGPNKGIVHCNVGMWLNNSYIFYSIQNLIRQLWTEAMYMIRKNLFCENSKGCFKNFLQFFLPLNICYPADIYICNVF